VYGGTPSQSFLQFIGPLRGTVLDIGAGLGAWGPDLRLAGAERLIAVEPDRASAESARSRYDLVIGCAVEQTAPEVFFEADFIILADCLEHLLDPWSTLRSLHDAARSGSQIILSIPNLRFLGLLAPVLIEGRFEYSDHGGIMDRGHLRWFTRSSLDCALRSSGWHPLAWSGEAGRGKRFNLDRFTARRFSELLCHQLYMKGIKLSEHLAVSWQSIE